MNENEIGGIVVDCAVKVQLRLGPGLQESVYEAVLSYESSTSGKAGGLKFVNRSKRLLRAPPKDDNDQ